LGARYNYLPSDPKKAYLVLNIMGAIKDLIEGIGKFQFGKIT